ncbi:hypothetical protein D5086_016191 [Populus alba]|uniref:Uncharacterized protein n=1 Tax=Populus alba TaxID=43335 RepID=A0ACC4BUR9_POPAL
MMACSLILRDQGEDDGFFRWIKTASDGFFASKSWAIESVVAERCDADMPRLEKGKMTVQNKNPLPIQGEKAFLTILGSRYISAGQIIYLGNRNRLKQNEELDRFLTFFPPPLCSSINHEGNPNYALRVHCRRGSNMDLNQPNPSPPRWSSVVPSTYARGLEEPITATRGNKLTMGTLKLPNS